MQIGATKTEELKARLKEALNLNSAKHTNNVLTEVVFIKMLQVIQEDPNLSGDIEIDSQWLKLPGSKKEQSIREFVQSQDWKEAEKSLDPIQEEKRPAKPPLLFKRAKPVDRELEDLSESNALLVQMLGVFKQDGKELFLTKQLEVLSQSENANKAPLPQLKACAIQGGGAKGAAYSGSKKAMEQLGVEPQIYSGASAGAITNVMMAFGYTADQFQRLSSSMDFRDFTDFNNSTGGAWFGGTKAGQLAAVLGSNYIYSGESFHEWIRGQFALVYEDPDITLNQLKERFPDSPDLILMGSRVDYAAKEHKVAFKAGNREWGDIKAADAVRASMSFPWAWNQFIVKNGLDKPLGTFTDGGFLSNLPLEVLDEDAYGTEYRQPERKLGGEIKRINPATFGFSLCSKLENLDPEVTPLTTRLEQLRSEKGLQNESAKGELQIKEEDENELIQRSKWTRFSLASTVVSNKFASGVGTAQLDKEKLHTYKGQVCQIYTEGVDTLDFELSTTQKAAIEKSAENAFINWFLQNRDPQRTYEDYYQDVSEDRDSTKPKNMFDNTKFKPNTRLDNSITTKLTDTQDDNTKNKDELKKIKFMAGLLVDMHQELEQVKKVLTLQGTLNAPQNEQIEKFNDLSKNQRLKFLSYKITELLDTPLFKEEPELFTKCLGAAREQIKLQDTNRSVKTEILEKNMDLRFIANKITDLLRDKDSKNIYLAETIFKGQMSNIFKLIEIEPGIINAFIQAGDPQVVQRILEKIRITGHQLDQQGRNWPIESPALRMQEKQTWENFQMRFNLLFDNHLNPNVYESAIRSKNSDVLSFLLQDKAKYGDPLHRKSDGKNALHEAIADNNPKAFLSLIDYCILHKETDRLLERDFSGNTVGHYLLESENLSKEFLDALLDREDVVKLIMPSSSKTEYGIGLSFGEQCFEKSKLNSELKYRLTELSKIIGDPFVTGQDLLTIKAPLLHECNRLTLEPDTMDAKSANDCFHLLAVTNDDRLNLLSRAALQNTPVLTGNIKNLLSKVDPQQAAELINCKTEKGSALYLAAQSGNHELVKLFLEKAPKSKLEFDKAGPYYECPSALTCAAKNKHLDVVKTLIDGKSKFQVSRIIQDKEGKSPLHYLFENGNLTFDDFWKFFNASNNPTKDQYLRQTLFQDNEGNTPLDILIQSTRLDLISGLLKENEKQSTISKVTVGKWYLDHYFKVDSVGLDKKSTIERLYDNKTEFTKANELRKLILENLSSETALKQDSKGQNVYHYLAKDKTLDHTMFNRYLNRGLTSGLQTAFTYRQRTDCIDNEGNSPLRSLFLNIRTDILDDIRKQSSSWLLDHYFDLNKIRPDGKSDLEFILENTKNENLEFTTQLLTSLSKDFYQKADSKGKTPFIRLIKSNQIEALKTLVTRETRKGWTAKDTWNLEDFFDFRTKQKNGMTDLESAILLAKNKLAFKDIVQLLYTNTGDLNLKKDAESFVDESRKQVDKQIKKMSKPQ